MIRWGILGAGYIANCFAGDFHRVNNSEIAAVAARDLNRAEAFAAKYGIGKAYGSYRELAEDKEVDVVYVATTHNFHLEHVKLCLEHGKHVLVEKPATVNSREFDEMCALAKERGLFLMEAMWTAFLPAIIRAKQWVDAGMIGKVTAVQADLGFALDLTPERRNINPALAAGTLLDLMIYPLTFGRIFSNSTVKEYQIMAEKHYSGADSADMIQLRYDNGVLGQFSASSCERYHNDGIIIGTKGRIVIKDFHMSKEAVMISDNMEISTLPSVMEERFVDNITDVMGYNYETQAVVECISQGLTECPVMPLCTTSQMMELMDGMRARIGVKYPFE